jgi:hypothetical protein
MKREQFIKTILLGTTGVFISKTNSISAGLYTLDIHDNGRAFHHPGILHTREDMERIRHYMKQKIDPPIGSYDILKKLPTASPDYKIQGPFSYIARDGVNRYTKTPVENDCNAAYRNAMMWMITGDKTHAQKAVEIINAYANTLGGITGSNDNALTASLDGFIFVNAAEIMRYTYKDWSTKDIAMCEDMFRNVFYKDLEDSFFNRKAYTNGNWGAAAIKAAMGFGIFLNDKAIYQKGVDLYYSKNRDNGSLYNYIINNTGQCQESGRDQQHVMLGLGNLAEACEVGFQQGLDMFGAMDNRLLKGYEYTAKYNLGQEVTFVQWKDVTGKYSHWPVISPKTRGRFRPVFEIAYNYYVNKKGLSMPWTEKVLEKTRPEGAPPYADHPGFGSLLFYHDQKKKA